MKKGFLLSSSSISSSPPNKKKAKAQSSSTSMNYSKGFLLHTAKSKKISDNIHNSVSSTKTPTSNPNKEPTKNNPWNKGFLLNHASKSKSVKTNNNNTISSIPCDENSHDNDNSQQESSGPAIKEPKVVTTTKNPILFTSNNYEDIQRKINNDDSKIKMKTNSSDLLSLEETKSSFSKQSTPNDKHKNDRHHKEYYDQSLNNPSNNNNNNHKRWLISIDNEDDKTVKKDPHTSSKLTLLSSLSTSSQEEKEEEWLRPIQTTTKINSLSDNKNNPPSIMKDNTILSSPLRVEDDKHFADTVVEKINLALRQWTATYNRCYGSLDSFLHHRSHSPNKRNKEEEEKGRRRKIHPLIVLSQNIQTWIRSNITMIENNMEIIWKKSNLLEWNSQHIRIREPNSVTNKISGTSCWWWYLPPCLQFGIVILQKNCHTDPPTQHNFDTQLLIWQASHSILTTKTITEHAVDNDYDNSDALLEIKDTKRQRQQCLGILFLWKIYLQNSNTPLDIQLCQSILLPKALVHFLQFLQFNNPDGGIPPKSILNVICIDALLSIFHYTSKVWQHYYHQYTSGSNNRAESDVGSTINVGRNNGNKVMIEVIKENNINVGLANEGKEHQLNTKDLFQRLTQQIVLKSFHSWTKMLNVMEQWALKKIKKHPLQYTIIQDWKSIISISSHNSLDLQSSVCQCFCNSILGNDEKTNLFSGGGLVTITCFISNRVKEEDEETTKTDSNNDAVSSVEKVLLQCLEKVPCYFFSSSSSSTDPFMDAITGCNALRGFVSMLDRRAREEKNKNISDTTNHWERRILEISIYLLRSNHDRCIKFVLAIFDYFWEHSNLFPLEKQDNGSWLDIVYKELKPTVDTTVANTTCCKTLEPCTESLCTFVSKIIYTNHIKQKDQRKILNKLISRNGFCISTIEIMILLLFQISNSQTSSGNTSPVISTTSSGKNSNIDKIKDMTLSTSKVDNNEEKMQSSTIQSMNKEMALFIWKHLMDIFETNLYLQKTVFKNPDVFSNAPIQMTVPPCVSILLSKNNENNGRNDMLESSALAAITRIIVKQSTNLEQAKNLVSKIMALLQKFMDEDSDSTSTTKQQRSELISKFCLKYGPVWKKKLLCSSDCIENGYPNFVLSIAYLMHLNPSSSILLPFFGTMIDNIEDGEKQKEESIENNRIRKATWELFAFGINCIEQVYSGRAINNDAIFEATTSGQYLLNSDNKGATSSCSSTDHVFRRLSPLLLLRRIPYFNFQLLYQEEINDKSLKVLQNFHKITLSYVMGYSIDSDTITEQIFHKSISQDERRLWIEILVRCLPSFSSASTKNSALAKTPGGMFCCFDSICKPPFSEIIKIIQSKGGDEQVSINPDLTQRAKIGLYAVCHYVSIAGNDDDGECIIFTFDFILEVLSSLGRYIEDELFLQLQTGCIDTIAICLNSHSSRQMKEPISKSTDPTIPLVKEIDSDTSSPSNHVDCKSTIYSRITKHRKMTMVLGQIFHQTLSIAVSKERTNSSLLKSFKKIYPSKHIISERTRICMFNSFIIASQKCIVDDWKKTIFVNKAVPEVLKWCLDCKMDLFKLYHPLCLAAALQFIFIVITRSKSFDCFCRGEKDKNILGIFNWALDIVGLTGGDESLMGSVRLKALKLILSMISVDQLLQNHENDTLDSLLYNTGKYTYHLSPREINRAYSIVRGAANLDESKEMKQLANTVLSALQQKQY